MTPGFIGYEIMVHTYLLAIIMKLVRYLDYERDLKEIVYFCYMTYWSQPKFNILDTEDLIILVRFSTGFNILLFNLAHYNLVLIMSARDQILKNDAFLKYIWYSPGLIYNQNPYSSFFFNFMTLGKRLEIMIYHFIAFPTQTGEIGWEYKKRVWNCSKLCDKWTTYADDYDQNR